MERFMKSNLDIAMFGHKRIPSREGGIEIVVEELCTRMVNKGNRVTCYNRAGHHVSGAALYLALDAGCCKGGNRQRQKDREGQNPCRNSFDSSHLYFPL